MAIMRSRKLRESKALSDTKMDDFTPASGASRPLREEKQRLVSTSSQTAIAAQLKFQSEQLKSNLNLVIHLNQKIASRLDERPSFFSDEYFYFNLLKKIKTESAEMILALDQVEMVIRSKGYVPPIDIEPLVKKLDEVYKNLKKFPNKLIATLKKAVDRYTVEVRCCDVLLAHPNDIIRPDQKNQLIMSDESFINNIAIPMLTQFREKYSALLNAVLLLKKEIYKIFDITEQPDPSKDPLLIFRRSNPVPMDIKHSAKLQIKHDCKDEEYSANELSIFRTSKPVPMVNKPKNNHNSVKIENSTNAAYKR